MDELAKNSSRLPAKPLLNFIRTTYQPGWLSWSIKGGIVLHVFLPRKIDNRESRFDKFAHRMRFSCCHDIIIRRVVLQHQPHRMDIILCAAPIPFAFQVPEHKLCNEPSRNARSRTRDFASHKVLRAPRRLVIVKNAVADKQPVGFAINSRQLRGERLGSAVRTRRSQRRVLGLRNFECISENFRSRRVIKSGGLRLRARDFKQAQGRYPRFFAVRFWNFKTQANVALSGKMIQLRRTDIGNNAPLVLSARSP